MSEMLLSRRFSHVRLMACSSPVKFANVSVFGVKLGQRCHIRRRDGDTRRFAEGGLNFSAEVRVGDGYRRCWGVKLNCNPSAL